MKLSNPQALEEGNVSHLNRLMEEAQVKNYLVNHPQFLQQNPELLAHMELSHHVGKTTSLVERQIKVLREKNQSLQGKLVEMLLAAHNNEKLLLDCNQFMLELLDTENIQSLCASIINLLKRDFNLDGAALILVGQYPPADPALIYYAASDIKKLLNCQFPDSQPLCGRLEVEPKRVLFGEMGRELQSCALIPLGEQCEYGLLALASKEVDRFEPEMGTLFIELIANLITHLTRQYEAC